MSTNSEPDFSAAIERFRTIAATSGDALLTEGRVHPDHDLLTLVAEAHDLKAETDSIDREARRLAHAFRGNPDFDAQIAARNKLHNRRKAALTRIGRIKAATAAGVYGKATLVHDRYSTAPGLAMSLAGDLLFLPGLRAALWPAGEGA